MALAHYTDRLTASRIAWALTVAAAAPRAATLQAAARPGGAGGSAPEATQNTCPPIHPSVTADPTKVTTPSRRHRRTRTPRRLPQWQTATNAAALSPTGL